MRKIREAITAYRFTQHYTKQQILEMYLNHVYYGNRSYGIDAASQTYFNKHPWNLTLGEASMLAGLPQAPSLYDPTQDFELAKARQKYVLAQMVKQDMITQQQADDAYAEPLNPQSHVVSTDVAPHFVNYVKYYLEQEFGADVLYRGGLTVRTTLDLDMQNTAQQIVTQRVKELAPYDADNGALVAILPADRRDCGDGRKRRLQQRSRSMARSTLPYASGSLAARSSRSPIWLHSKRGGTPGRLCLTTPNSGRLRARRTRFYGPHNDTLQNFGAVSVRTALANSLNIPAVQALDYVGVTNMIDLAHKMGIQTGLWRGPSFYGLAITLGGGEVTAVGAHQRLRHAGEQWSLRALHADPRSSGQQRQRSVQPRP